VSRVRVVAPLFLVLSSACGDSLIVDNVDQPDVGRVFSTASSIEQTIATRFQTCHNSRTDLWGQMAVLSLEGASTIPNLIGRVLIPRAQIANSVGATPSIYSDFSNLATNGRVAANAVTALDNLISRGGTLGTDAQNLRARAFGYFAVGCHLGWLAMTYDSAAIATPGIDAESVPPLSGAQDVMRAAIAMFDTAISIASSPTASTTGGFPLPATWVNGTALSSGEFIRMVRSYRARFRAGVARTPAEREKVDWPAIIADAENGVMSDMMITVGGSSGWSNYVGTTGNVTALSMMYYGMADVSGAYDAWLALPLENRDVFLVVTPDRRWPQGATRAAQQAAGATAGANFNSVPILTNRTDAVTGLPWTVSFYRFSRFAYLPNNAASGLYPIVTKAEMNLLAAEGYLRAGDIATAAAKIDITRVGRAQLPALTGVITTTTQAIPGGASCVPRVPKPGAAGTTCGNIWEAMKWEKRMETALTGYGQWYFDSRGWGDLVQDTPLEFPVPYQELSARHLPYYNLGGGLKSSAPKGTYGF
jgi:hypothetical protein